MKRNQKRIKKILAQVEKIWIRFPELSFTQLLHTIDDEIFRDLHLLYDDCYLEMVLDEFVNRMKNKKEDPR